MRRCIILNPGAGSAEQASALHEALARQPDTSLLETKQAGEARALALQALRDGCEMVVAAGGDGTINEVINGIAPDLEHAPRLGIIPLGTGNDLARTLALPEDPVEALRLLDSGEERRLDLMKVETGDGIIRYAINVAAGGFSGQVDEVMTPELKASWGPLAYLAGAAGVLPNLTGYETTIACDGEPPERIEALNIIVANARTAAGGFNVAPYANPEDGELDLVIVRYGNLVDLAGVAARLLLGNYIDSQQVYHRCASTLTIRSRPNMWFNVDGELLTNSSVTFTVQPKALRVIVGPGYRAEGQGAKDNGGDREQGTGDGS